MTSFHAQFDFSGECHGSRWRAALVSISSAIRKRLITFAIVLPIAVLIVEISCVNAQSLPTIQTPVFRKSPLVVERVSDPSAVEPTPVRDENKLHSLDNLLDPLPRPTVEWVTNEHFELELDDEQLGSKPTSALKASTRKLMGPRGGLSELGQQEQSLGEAAGVPQNQFLTQRLVGSSIDPIKVFNESASGGPMIDPSGRRPSQFQEEGRSGGFLPGGPTSPRQEISPAPFSLDNFPSSARPDEAAQGGESEAEKVTQDEVVESLPEAIASQPRSKPGRNQGEDTGTIAAPRRETIVENYPNGKPRLYRTVAMDEEGNYYKDGEWRAVDQQGNDVAKGTYRKGVMEGQWGRRHLASEGGMFATKPFTSYQGPFDSYAFFKNGLLDGRWVIYSADKRSVFEIGYKNGKRHGEAVWYYPDRERMRTATFKDGVLDGEVLEWDEDKRLVLRDRYYEGRKVVRTTAMYRPDQKKSEAFFLDARLEPEGLDNWWEAKPAPFVTSGARVQNGPVRSWYSNQQLRYSGQYKDDHPIGQFFWWHENGIRKTVGFYNEEGQRSGRWIWWHPNGMKQIEGSYEGGQPVGLWRSWFDSGELQKERDYDEDRDDFFGSSTAEPDRSKETETGSDNGAAEANVPELSSPKDATDESVGELPAPQESSEPEAETIENR